ncbi:MAG TPA: hypothetical protein VK163_05470, partial [Opitutaceae bacterium]|nr:hypothetical protein [Opitutaceae bacterium]
MPTRNRSLRSCALLAACCTLASLGFAKMEQWTDAQGKTFKGEPAQALGPLALFKIPGNSSKLVPFGQISTQDCVRFATQMRNVPQPAADWSKTKTEIGYDIYDNVVRVEGSDLKPVSLKGRKEPPLYALFFVSNGEGKSWGVLGRAGWQMQNMQKQYPGMIEGLMFGLKHSNSDQRNMAVTMKVPFLVAAFDSQSHMYSVAELIPGWGYGVVFCNVNGVPIFASKMDTDEMGTAFMGEIGKLLDVIRPDNPKGWNDAMHYWMAAQPVLHANDTCDPQLVGDPLNVAKAHELGIEAFEAAIDVSADGTITAVEIAPGATCPKDLLEPISQALHQARIVPAVDHGKFVAGRY